MKLETFVFGKEKAPAWFNDVCAIGRAKINYDEENVIISATLHTPTGIQTAKVGDSIVYTNSGLAVIPEDKAKKYGVQRGGKVEKTTEESPKSE